MAQSVKSNTYRNYMVALLMVMVGLAYVDRMVFGVVQQAIKVSLALSDTQMGFLNGLGLIIFFCLVGIPLSRWADRGNRVVIAALSSGLWAVTVTLCGAAGSFLQIFLVRIGVAVGEAGVGTPANSLIPEYFDRSERPRAMSRYMLGIPLGLVVGYFAGGWLNQLYGWRTTFVMVALPGFIVSVLAAMSLKEPRITRSTVSNASESPSSREPARSTSSLRAAVTTLAGIPAIRHLTIASVIYYFAGWAILAWQPPFFIRVHGMETGELGTWLALVNVTSLAGSLLGGEWASRFAPNNERLQLRGVCIAFIAMAVLQNIAFYVGSYRVAFGALAVSNLCGYAAAALLASTVQTLAPPHMRATAVALVALLPTFIGAGFGPLAAGILSDALHPWAGDQSLRYTLLFFCPWFIWAGFHLWRAGQTVQEDLAAVGSQGALEIPKRLAIVTVCALTSMAAASKAMAAEEAPLRIDTDGTLHVPPMEVPPSSLWSPELKEAYARMLQGAWASRDNPAAFKDVPARDAPQAAWDKFYAESNARLAAGLPALLKRYSVKVSDTEMDGVRVRIVTPDNGVAPENAHRILINLHGGAFVFSGGGVWSQFESAPIASLGHIQVVMVDYRQAPRHHYPAASEDVEAVYRTLLKDYGPGSIGIFGCSAGGSLAAQAVSWIAAKGLPRPGAVGIFCAAPPVPPNFWGALGDSKMWDVYGAMQPQPYVPAFHWYMEKARADDPGAYPGISDAVLARFPPTLFVTGTRSIELSVAARAHAHLLKLGVDSFFYLMEGGWHGAPFIALGTPEAHEANAYIARWFSERLAR